MSKRALVTGGNGFLGQHLCRALHDRGWEVHITSRFSDKSDVPGCSAHICDLASFAAAEKLVAELTPQVIYHFAGAVSADPRSDLVLPMFNSQLASSVNLLTIVTQHPGPRLLLTGSLTEGNGRSASSPYGAAKSAATLYARMFFALYKTPVTVLRTFMTFGSGQRDTKVLPYVIRSLNAGQTPKISSGSWRADWIHVSDVTEAFVRAASAPRIEGIELDIGRGELKSLKEMVESIRDLMNSDIEVAFGAREDRPDEPERVANVDNTERHLGWRSSVELLDGLRETINAYV